MSGSSTPRAAVRGRQGVAHPVGREETQHGNPASSSSSSSSSSSAVVVAATSSATATVRDAAQQVWVPPERQQQQQLNQQTQQQLQQLQMNEMQRQYELFVAEGGVLACPICGTAAATLAALDGHMDAAHAFGAGETTTTSTTIPTTRAPADAVLGWLRKAHGRLLGAAGGLRGGAMAPMGLLAGPWAPFELNADDASGVSSLVRERALAAAAAAAAASQVSQVSQVPQTNQSNQSNQFSQIPNVSAAAMSIESMLVALRALGLVNIESPSRSPANLDLDSNSSPTSTSNYYTNDSTNLNSNSKDKQRDSNEAVVARILTPYIGEQLVTRLHWQHSSSTSSTSSIERCAIAACGRQLGLITAAGRTNCRRCGRLVCDVHARFQMKLAPDASHDPTGGIWCRVCIECFTNRDGYADPYGVSRNKSAVFNRIRTLHRDRSRIEANKLATRLERIVRAYAGDSASIVFPSSSSSSIAISSSSSTAVASSSSLISSVPSSPILHQQYLPASSSSTSSPRMSSQMAKLSVSNQHNRHPSGTSVGLGLGLGLSGILSRTQTIEQSIVAWAPDNSASSCHVCDKPFGITNRRHHCRLCGLLTCSSCSRILEIRGHDAGSTTTALSNTSNSSAAGYKISDLRTCSTCFGLITLYQPPTIFSSTSSSSVSKLYSINGVNGSGAVISNGAVGSVYGHAGIGASSISTSSIASSVTIPTTTSSSTRIIDESSPVTAALVPLHTQLTTLKQKIQQLLPEFNNLLVDLRNRHAPLRHDDHDYQVALRYRKTLVDWFSEIDRIGKRIRAVSMVGHVTVHVGGNGNGFGDTRDDTRVETVVPLSTTAKRLYDHIHMATLQYLQSHMLTLQLMPTTTTTTPSLTPHGGKSVNASIDTTPSFVIPSTPPTFTNTRDTDTYTTATRTASAITDQIRQLESTVIDLTSRRRYDDAQMIHAHVDELYSVLGVQQRIVQQLLSQQ